MRPGCEAINFAASKSLAAGELTSSLLGMMPISGVLTDGSPTAKGVGVSVTGSAVRVGIGWGPSARVPVAKAAASIDTRTSAVTINLLVVIKGNGIDYLSIQQVVFRD